jgi:hypothetical protein
VPFWEGVLNGVGEARPVPLSVKSASVTLVLTVPFPTDTTFGEGAGTGSVLLPAGTSGVVVVAIVVEEPDGEVCGKVCGKVSDWDEEELEDEEPGVCSKGSDWGEEDDIKDWDEEDDIKVSNGEGEGEGVVTSGTIDEVLEGLGTVEDALEGGDSCFLLAEY